MRLPPRRPSALFWRQILALQQGLFRRQQRRIDAAVSDYTPAFRRYARRYRRLFASGWRRCASHQLQAAAVRADLIYFGDYHTLPAAQACFLVLVRGLPATRPLSLGLELFHTRHQRRLERYLAGHLDAETLLKAAGLRPDRGSWAPYLALVELARQHGWRLVALDSPRGARTGTSLARCDAQAAVRLAQELRLHPERRLVVLMGELHLAPMHLPQAVQARLPPGAPPPRQITIYQNNPILYDRLLIRGLAAQSACMRAGTAFCLFHTAPVVCQQSFLNSLDAGEDGDYVAAPEQAFRDVARRLATFFDLPLGDRLDRLTIETVVDLSFLSRLRHRGTFSPHEVRLICSQIARSDSAYIPRAQLVYLGNHAAHHVSEEATHFLRHGCLEEGAQEPRGLVDAFYSRCIEEALGFLGAKLMDPRRQCLSPSAWRRLARDPRASPRSRRMGQLLLRHLRLETGQRVRDMAAVYGCDAEMFNALTHLLGYRLGARLYAGLARGRLQQAQIRALFFDALEEEGVALATYLHLIRRPIE